MAGTLIGWVDRVINESVSANVNQALFTTVFQFLNGPALSSSYTELVSLQFGNGANGTNFPDETNPFGENAFAVFRMLSGSNAGGDSARAHDYYILMQWADASSFGASPGNPGQANGSTSSDGVAFSMAWLDDGGNPWNGGTAAAGADSKGTPVWSDGGNANNTIRVFPMANTSGGDDNTNKDNMTRIADLGGSLNSNHRIHCLADRDNFWIALDTNDDGTTLNGYAHFGVYDPIPELSGSIDMPMFAFVNNGSVEYNIGTIYGNDPDGNDAATGIVNGPSGSQSHDIESFAIGRYTTLVADANVQPNQMLSSSHGAYNPAICVYRSPDFGHIGYINTPETLSAPVYSVNPASSSVIFGGSPRLVLPWSGSQPGSVTAGRTGRVFQL